jgi:hypothetical protein
METYVQSSFTSRAEAEAAANALIGRGIPAHCVQVSEGAEAIVDGDPPVGTSLGFGVPVEATNALISEHDEEATPISSDLVYVVSVDTRGDEEQLDIARRFFGYAA